MFSLNERLGSDTFEVCDLKLSKVLLMNDTLYPWLILVPCMDDLVEITDLSLEDRILLMKEISAVSEVLQELTGADKMNIGALGNVVSQLHIHVIARFKNDSTWPDPVWGKLKAVPYGENIKNEFISTLSQKISEKVSMSS